MVVWCGGYQIVPIVHVDIVNVNVYLTYIQVGEVGKGLFDYRSKH